MDERILRMLLPVRNDAGAAAVFLDLDGTLAPIVPDPAAVRVHPAISALLPQLVRRYRLVALVTGRSLHDVRAIVGLPGAWFAGNHGLEIVAPDGSSVDVPDVETGPLQAFAAKWPEAALDAEGVWLENKLQTLTFHYRNAPDPDSARNWLMDKVAPVGHGAGLRVEEGRMSLEVHPAGVASKGTAVAQILAAAPGVRHAVSLGDDRTDTTIWRYIHDLRSRARLRSAVAVGVTSSETPDIVRDHADVLVEGVDGSAEVLGMLAG